MEPIVETIAHNNRNEFLRKRLIDEVDKAFIDLRTILSQIDNNFQAIDSVDKKNLEISTVCLREAYLTMLDRIKCETSF